VTANEALLDAQVRHAIYVQRFGGGQVNRFIALLNRADADVVDIIKVRVAKIAERGYDTGPATTKRLNAVLDAIREVTAQAYADAGKELTAQLTDFVIYERDWQIAQIEQPLPVAVQVIQPTAEVVTAAALKRPFQGRLLKEWLAGVEEAKAARVRDAIRLGLVEGETIDQMVRRIRGTRPRQYQDGLLEIDRRGAAAMVRTAVNHTSNAARDSVFAANDFLLNGVRWVSTLDARTTPICQARDGKVYPTNSGPRPPAHIGCRSATVAALKSWRELGLNIDDVPAPTRASLNGQVPGDLTYGEWLKRQPAAFQDDVLGTSKGKLFRLGELPVDRFVDRAGRELTLAELRVKEPAAFRRAGL
jgi:SPP1 gp7 family putative phage head morphogenesis protein